MGTSLRALRALFLLAGFYVLALAVLCVLAGAALAAWAWAPTGGAVTATVLAVLVGLPVLRGVCTLGTGDGDDKHGLAVTEAEQPELWHAVRSLAERTGTRAPDTLFLTEEVNAAVQERTRLLGLLPGRRSLYLGVPLLIGLSEPQLHSVIAHELGHYGNADTRLAGITLRGRDSVLRTVAGFQAPGRARSDRKKTRRSGDGTASTGAGAERRRSAVTDTVRAVRSGLGRIARPLLYGVVARPFQAYARFYLRATQSVGRQQELAADRVAARVAGRDATVSALREIAVLDAVHDVYVGRYIGLGARAGLLPPRGEVVGGVRQLLDDPELRADLAELRGELPSGEPTPYDSHPPVAERVRLIEALPDDGPATSPARPALTLLRDAERVLVEVEGTVLTPEALAMERTDWPDLTHRAVHTLTEADARPLRTAMAAFGITPGSAAEDLAALLDAVDAGRLWWVARHLPKSREAARASGRAAREFLRPDLEEGTQHLAELALVEAAGARWEPSWAAGPRLRLPGERDIEDELAAAVRAAVADTPDTGPLRGLLAG
ncbi:M48 family metallopeptidase [Streptomyces sp. NPDC026294]|uniref:M48 family metallopeptidase n=1 Tax=Streptomyces sp. NPDC026294 TaxID=3155362 RepID=UPI0033CE7BC4